MTRVEASGSRAATGRLLSAVVAISVLMGAAALSDAADAAGPATTVAVATKGSAAPSIAGRYVRRSPAFADMTISPDHGQWRIDVSGSARAPSAGETPADCHGVAVGPDVDGVIHAKVVPFADDNMDVSADDLKDHPAAMVVEVSRGRVRVVQSSVETFCGMFSDLRGTYARVPAHSRQGPR